MLALADFFNLFAYKFAGLRRGRLSLICCLAGAGKSFFSRHSQQNQVLEVPLPPELSMDKNSSRCRCINSSRPLCAVADGSREWAIARFRQTHSSTASETSFCLVIPRKSHCFASHSNCCELISIRSEALASSGSSGHDPDSCFRTN